MVWACVFQKKNTSDFLKIPEIKSLNDLLENYDLVYIYKPKKLDPERVFENGNGIGRRLPLKYSLSVGDIVGFFENGKLKNLYICMPVGWKEIGGGLFEGESANEFTS